MRCVRGTLIAALGLTILAGSAPSAWAFKIVSFDGKFSRWPRPQAHYQVDLRGSGDFNGDATKGCDGTGACVTIQQAVRKSFQNWAKVTGAEIEFIEDAPATVTKTGYDHKNTITWIDSNWLGQPFAPPTGALAVTISTYKIDNSEIVDSDIQFNGEYFHWAVINTPEEETADVVDVENIATHEIGHFIGLDHSSEDIFESDPRLYNATMFFASGPGEIFRRNLKEDDVAALTNLYPADDPPEPRITSIDPESVDASASALVPVRIRGSNFETSAMVLLAMSGDRGDVIAHVISLSEDEISVVLDLSTVPSGRYDLMVANSFNKTDRLEQGLTVTGGGASWGGDPGYGESTSMGGGCGVISSESGSGFTGLILLLFPLILIAASRICFAVRSGGAKATPDEVQ